ncbi:MAG TPA: branched-chain amino acid ABC transporter permease [Thermoplasmata archaeon]|nr:branched-chain amino acid ABC transporter permease [Thermoplasmata archaeon]
MTTPRSGLRNLTQSLTRVPWWGTVLSIFAVASLALYLWMPLGGRPLVLQAIIQGFVVGSVYVLGASGLSLNYGIKKFANFAHGDMMTVGAYVAFTATAILRWHIVAGFLAAMFAVAFLGIFLEMSVFRRLEKRGEIAALIASVGVSLVLQNTIGIIFLGNPLYMPVQTPQDFQIGNTGLSFNWFKGGLTIALAVLLMVFLHVLLKYTTLGKAMRACADDLDLARASGINTRNVILWTWAISGGLAGIAGVLLGILVNLVPLVGFFVLLFIFSSVIVGGIGSPYGAMVGGFLIGIVEKLSSVFFGQLTSMGIVENGASYGPAGAFVVMVLVLLIKPEGLMGRRRPSEGRRRRGALFARRIPKEVADVGD